MYSQQESEALTGALLTSYPSDYIQSLKTDCLLLERSALPPTLEEVRVAIQLKTISAKLQHLLLTFWRAKLCKEQNRFMNAWMFEVQKNRQGQPSIVILDELVDENRKAILSNSDSSYIIITICFGENLYVLEYNKVTGIICYLNFVSDKQASESERQVSMLAGSAFHYVDRINKEFLKSQL